MSSSAERFLEELRYQYNKEFEFKSTLESKANNIITASGAIAGFFLLFGTFLLGGLHSESNLSEQATRLLIGGIATAVGANLCSLISSLIIKYTYALADVCINH